MLHKLFVLVTGAAVVASIWLDHLTETTETKTLCASKGCTQAITYDSDHHVSLWANVGLTATIGPHLVPYDGKLSHMQRRPNLVNESYELAVREIKL